jgi:hypothetical protein
MNHTARQTIEYETCSASVLISSLPRAVWGDCVVRKRMVTATDPIPLQLLIRIKKKNQMVNVPCVVKPCQENSCVGACMIVW